jgi:methylenetetrahydrofolate reductase (NADPH)
MPHIVARSLGSAADLEQQLFELARQGVAERVFIVAGDLPSPKGPFPDALSVICSGLLEQHGVGHVGISGYPSGHPTIDEKRLCQAMEHKLVALSDRSLTSSIVTQFSFDPNAVMDWLDVVRARGIDIPIRLGVPGPASTTALLRFSARCGVQASAKAMRRFGFSLTRLVDTSGPDQLVRHMAARFNPTVHGDVALHFYPFGGVAKTLDWLGAFGARK